MQVYIEGPNIDSSTRAVMTVPYAHHEIHSGSAFTAGFAKTIGIGETAIMHIKTPNSAKRCHLVGTVTVSGEVNVTWLEAVEITGNGTAVTGICRRRDDLKGTATVLTYHTPTYSGGTTLGIYHAGSGRNQGDVRETNEWILAPNTSYVLLVTGEAASIDCQIILNWYEHQDKWR